MAFQQNMVDKLPVKSKKLAKRERFFHYLVLTHAGDTLLRKRTKKDIWQHLYEFPMIELSAVQSDTNRLKKEPLWQQLIGERAHEVASVSRIFRQTLTHQVIHAIFIEIEMQTALFAENDVYTKIKRKNLSNFAFPKVIDWYLQDNSLYLNLH